MTLKQPASECLEIIEVSFSVVLSDKLGGQKQSSLFDKFELKVY